MKYKLTALLGAAIALGGMVSPAMAQYSSYPPPTNGYPGVPTNGYPGVPANSYPGVPTTNYPLNGTGPGVVYPPPAGTQTGNPYYPPAVSTSFICGRVGIYPATLVQVNGRVLQSPLIIWQTETSTLSPEERCQMASQRLTAAVAQNGGKLSNLLLTTGKVNGYAVICFVNTAETCNPSNVIMTLIRRDNARNPGNVLARIVRFGRQGGGANVLESGGYTGGGSGEEDIVPTAISLEEAVNQVASESNSLESGGMPQNQTGGSYTPPPPADTGGGGSI